MVAYRNLALGLVLALGMALPAMAQQRVSPEATGSLNIDTYTLMVIQPNGLMTMVHVDKAMADEMMKHSKAMGTMMVLTHNGKSYAVDDMKMANGMMASSFLTREQKIP